MTAAIKSVALIGFGEVGVILAEDLAAAGVRDIRAFDIAFAEAGSRQLAAARRCVVTVAATPHAALAGADLAISAVTAGAALDAVCACAGALHGALFVDVNSVAPRTKIAGAAIVEAAGGRYVEAAVMAPFPPRRLKTPILLGGSHAQTLLDAISGWPHAARVYSQSIGAASAVKMCRSVMIKGLEGLTIECVLAAKHYGVLDDVLASLIDMFPGQDWHAKAHYLIGRTLAHGRRRAEEMREVAKTIEAADFDPVMTRAIVEKQDWAADLGDAIGAARADAGDLAALLDALDKALPRAAAAQ
jgi:3-hydroxyisobutyrate dehydrogenase